ncbi:MAG: tetratricopeptide repeat protein [bacterium]
MNKLVGILNKFVLLSILVILYVSGVSAEAAKSAVDTAVLKAEKIKTATPAQSWYTPKEVIGRLEIEYEMIQIIIRELSRIRNANEDLRDFQLYPSRLTQMGNRAMVRMDRLIEKSEKKEKGYRVIIMENKRALVDAIAMTRELLAEDPEALMFSTIRQENINRIKDILEVKHRVNSEWDSLMILLKEINDIAGIKIREEADLQGFEKEFFKILNASLGRSSEAFYKKLSLIKEAIIKKCNNRELNLITKTELSRVKKRINSGSLDIARIQLKGMISHFGANIDLNSVYYLLGITQYGLGDYIGALNSYKSVNTRSPFRINAQIGIYQTLFILGRNKEIINQYESNPLKVENPELHNMICYIIAESYYNEDKYDKLMSVTNTIKSQVPYYEAAFYVLGQTYIKKKDYDLAQSIFKKISTNTPQSEIDRQVISKAIMALAHLNFYRGRYKTALSQYMDLIKKEEFFAEALYGIAWCYIKTDNLQKAEVTLKRLVNQAADNIWGARALMDLSVNFSRHARLEWDYKIALEQDRKKVLNWVQRLNDDNHQLDPERYNRLKSRLDSIQKSLSTKEPADYTQIKKLFNNAIMTTQIVKSYNSGVYIGDEVAEQREKLLQSIHRLLEQVKLGESINEKWKLMKEQQQLSEKKKMFANTANKAGLMELGFLLEKQAWMDEYAQWYISDLDEKIGRSLTQKR